MEEEINALETKIAAIRKSLQEKHELEQAFAQKLQKQQQGYIKLNVGGIFYTTSKSTLSKYPGSMLESLVSGRFPLKPMEDGSYFIDRDGRLFGILLNALRTEALLIPSDFHDYEALAVEIEFYQLPFSIPHSKGVADFSRSELLQILATQSQTTTRNFTSMRFCGLDFSNFRFNSFSNCTWIACDFSGCNLRGAVFDGMTLERCSFRSACLAQASLSSCGLTQADFHSANLEGAKLTSSTLTSADLTECNLKGADCKSANFNSAKLSKANLAGTNFTSASLGGASLDRADMSTANWTNATGIPPRT